MAKLALILSILATGVAGYLLLTRGEPQASAPAGVLPSGNADIDALARRTQEEVQKTLSAQSDRLLRELDQRLKRLDQLRTDWTEALQRAQKSAENAAHENTGKLEELDQMVAAHSVGIEKATQSLEAMLTRIKALEARPVAVAGPAPGPAAPAKPKEPPPTAPGTPELPSTPAESPEAIKAKVDKALGELDQTDPERLYPAITVVQKYKALEAVPKLVKLIHPEPHADFFTRQAAVAALGEMRACDAVPALAEALLDKSAIVAQQANKSLRLITERDNELSPQAKIIERRKVRGEVLEWWGRHETEVRTRLGQPKGGAPK
jgi:hypothetical protein